MLKFKIIDMKFLFHYLEIQGTLACEYERIFEDCSD